MSINRRQFVAGASASLLASAASGADQEIRLGVIGVGARGSVLLKSALQIPNVRVNALCEIQEDRAQAGQKMVKDAQRGQPELYWRGKEDYKRMLERTDLDAVLIATPQKEHGFQSIAAMRAGKHVASETPAGYSLDELWELVETKEKTGKRYMLLENYIYARPHMQVLNMVRKGAFGELTYGECGYVHDTRYLTYDGEDLSWRGRVARDHRGDLYPTHGLGPMATWMGINRGDRLVSMVSMDTNNLNLQTFAAEKFGKDNKYAQPGFFRKRDTTVTLIRTALERVIVLKYETTAPKPFSPWDTLDGTKACYTGSGAGEFIHFAADGERVGWKPLADYRKDYEHAYWRASGSDAQREGHGGGDYFVMREFFNAIRADREPPVDVYDAASWTAVLPLSGKSIESGNKPVEFPDFTKGKWKTRSSVDWISG
jgi:predicted dehydrogenase